MPKKTSTVTKVIAGTALLMVLYGIFQANSGPESVPIPVQKSAADLQKEREFATTVTALRGLKSKMKNPGSFVLVQALMVQGPTLCVVYRGTNSFNAVVTNHIAIWDKGSSDDSTQWNKRCGGKPGDDYTYASRAL